MADFNNENAQLPSEIQNTAENCTSTEQSAECTNTRVDAQGNRGSKSSSELSPDKVDSLTDDYVHVDQVPDIDSEEVRNFSYQQPLISEYFSGYLSNIQLPMPISNFLPIWMYGTATEGDSTTTETSEEQRNFDSWVREKFQGVNMDSIEGEQRFRDCLVKAISDHFDGMKDIDVDFLIKSCGLTKEEILYARESEPQCTRRLLLMLLCRGTRTMLSFLFGLCTVAKDIVEQAIRAFHCYWEEGFKKEMQCLHCLLKVRVCICLIVDHLPTCDSVFLSFVTVVSEESQPARPSVSGKLWEELFKVIMNKKLYKKVVKLLIGVIESCGYHSDIVQMLKEDKERKRNSFICRCKEMTECQAISDAGNQKKSTPTNPHDGRTILNTLSVAEGLCDQEVKAIETESGAEPSMLPPKRKQPDDRSDNETWKKKPPDARNDNETWKKKPPDARNDNETWKKKPPDDRNDKETWEKKPPDDRNDNETRKKKPPDDRSDSETWKKKPPDDRNDNETWKKKPPDARNDNETWKKKPLDARNDNETWKNKPPDARNDNETGKKKPPDARNDKETWEKKPPDDRNDNETRKKKPPHTSTLIDKRAVMKNNPSSLKRKETPGGHDFNGKRSRNSVEDGSASCGNCDLQMEMLKIGIAGQENEQDSLFSSTRSKDSGVFEQTTIDSSSVDDEETVPKEIASGIKLSTFETGRDQNTAGASRDVDGTTGEKQENVHAADQLQTGDLRLVPLDLDSNENDMEEMISSPEQDMGVIENDAHDFSTMTL